MVGTSEDDALLGTAERDFIRGRAGDDVIEGGDGNDRIRGGRGNDQINAGDGSDHVRAGKGDDIVFHNVRENLGDHDCYNGGRGFDTLVIQAREEERTALEDSGVMGDLVEQKVDFEDLSLGFDMDLTVRKFERVVFDLTAQDDVATTDEDTAIQVDVLANDLILSGEALEVVGFDATGLQGTLSLLNGVLTYDPGAAFQSLNEGEIAQETFRYTVQSEVGSVHSAEATITIEGRDDAPVGGVVNGTSGNDNFNSSPPTGSDAGDTLNGYLFDGKKVWVEVDVTVQTS